MTKPKENITKDFLREFFHLPIAEASQKIGICVTVLKKICRQYGIIRWPYRKLHSIDKNMAALKEMNDDNEDIKREIIMLSKKRKRIMEHPEILSKKNRRGTLDDELLRTDEYDSQEVKVPQINEIVLKKPINVSIPKEQDSCEGKKDSLNSCSRVTDSQFVSPSTLLSKTYQNSPTANLMPEPLNTSIKSGLISNVSNVISTSSNNNNSNNVSTNVANVNSMNTNVHVNANANSNNYNYNISNNGGNVDLIKTAANAPSEEMGIVDDVMIIRSSDGFFIPVSRISPSIRKYYTLPSLGFKPIPSESLIYKE